MCGLLGLVACGEEAVISRSTERVARSLKLLKHRGPDRSRMTVFTPHRSSVTVSADSDLSYLPPAQVILGHNRLSIIDLSNKANQPMPYGDLWLVYNGEIYNYKDLRALMEEQDFSFSSESDSEVLLAMYEAYGPEMVHRLNGMFAFAIWDVDRKSLFMARDRYGIKPLYYTRLPNGEFAFASEVKALLTLGADKSLDVQALSEHLTFQNMFEGRTLLKSVRMLEPGHWARLDADSGELFVQKYWEPVFAPDGTQSANWADEVRHVFEDAVSSQLVGEVPIGSFLSGGMDTGAITAVTTRTLPNLHTFTAGFDLSGVEGDERLFDERLVSRELANHLQTRHHEMMISPDAMPACLPQMVWHLDDFRAGISYQNYLVSRMVAQHVTVVMSGVGGDELFAGYPWRYEPMLSFDSGNSPAFADQYYQSWTRLLSEEEKQSLFTPDLWRHLEGFSTRDSFKRVLKGCKAEHPLDKAMCFDMKTFLHGLLVVEDRLSMAHSVESRVPFLDNRLVDLGLTLPAETKLKRLADGQTASKWILREALRGLLPEEVLTRRKQGFTPPDATWYRGQTRRYIEDLLLSDQALQRGLFRPDTLRGLLESHFNGQRNHRFVIWSLMCLEWWHRLLIDPSEPAIPEIEKEMVGVHIQ
jgi:asparagine synthase (glutamine-hydrolysing)